MKESIVMSNRRWFSVLAGAPVILGGLLVLPSTAMALDEMHVYGIANFGHSGECEDDTSLSHSVHTSTAAAFRANFSFLQSVGLWDEVATRNNTSARGSYWTDSSKAASCACSTNDMATDAGADEADVVFIHTHGWHEAPSWMFPSTPAYSGLVMGNSSYDCGVRTDQNMRFGNPATSGDLEIAVVKACQSGDYDVWKNGGYRQQITTSDSTMTMWNAFHGDSSCGDHVTDYVGDYAAESLVDGVGENWIDEAYDNSWFGDDDCPSSIVFGASFAARESMYEHGGWRDRKNTGSKTGSTMFFIGGCDPSGGRTLPD
jgi:hypothetical protein